MCIAPTLPMGGGAAAAVGICDPAPDADAGRRGALLRPVEFLLLRLHTFVPLWKTSKFPSLASR
jgi:hypothetical protein